MAIELPAPELFKVEAQVDVRWGDMDALGHVNNSVFFTYFESARIAWFAKVAPGRTLEVGGVGPLLAHTSCDYLLPVEHPAQLAVGTRALRVGSSSLEVEHLVRDAKTGRVHAVGRAVMVFVDFRAKAKVPVPADVREGVRSLDGV